MPIVQKTFSVTTPNGATIYRAGMTVGNDLAKAFPQFMEGWKKETAAHDPDLPARIGKKEAEKMSRERLLQWIQQFHPGSAPEGETDKAALLELVNELNGR